MKETKCSECDFDLNDCNYAYSEEADSLEEYGICLSCRDDVEYCKGNHYAYGTRDVKSIDECGYCEECAEEYLDEPKFEDPDFWGSYDPS